MAPEIWHLGTAPRIVSPLPASTESPSQTVSTMSTPNILYLHTHDCGRFISPCGYDMPTPNLMKLAHQGTVFRQACCTSPTCSPSRAGLLFGQYGHVNGMMGLAWEGDRYVPRDFSHHLVPFLKQHDYQCAMSGIHHISKGLKDKIGYDRVLDVYEKGTLAEQADEGVTEETGIIEGAESFLHEQHDRPFFLSVGFGAPHRWAGDRRVFDREADHVPMDSAESAYTRPLPIFPDNPITRNDTANFRAGVKVMDEQFGAVLEALDRAGHADNTLVICTTDHGAGFPGMKGGLTDWGIGVFLLMRGPGIPAGQVLDGLVSQIDIYPTITELLGVDRPDWLQGESLWPLLRGDVDEIHEEIFAEQGYHGGPWPMRAIRTQRYKLIRNYLPEKGEFSPDRGPTDSFLREHGFDQRPSAAWTLFDLVFDPMERYNQAENPAYAEVFADLKTRLERFMRETDDPLTSGVLPPSPAMLEERT